MNLLVRIRSISSIPSTILEFESSMAQIECDNMCVMDSNECVSTQTSLCSHATIRKFHMCLQYVLCICAREAEVLYIPDCSYIEKIVTSD